jgi:hypothetical protein
MNSIPFSNPNYVDLYEFCEFVKQQIVDNASIQQMANNVQIAINATVINQKNKIADIVKGISIYFPINGTNYSPAYELLKYPMNSCWSQFLTWVYLRGGAGSGDDYFEENDLISQSSIIVPGYWTGLNCLDDDYYAIYLESGEFLNVSIYFKHNPLNSNLDMALYNQSLVIINSSTSLDDYEEVSVISPIDGWYYIKIYASAGNSTYDMFIYAPYSPDDMFGDNRDITTAANIDALVNTGWIHNLRGNHDDYYNFTVVSGDLINISLTQAVGDGDLTLYLIDPMGMIIDYSSTDGDEIIVIGAPISGVYCILVEILHGDSIHPIPFTSNYSLMVGVTQVDDIFEENDRIDQAYEITSGNYFNLVCLDPDYYNITLESGECLNASISFDNRAGNLNITILDLDGNVIASQDTFSSIETVFCIISRAGNFTVLVNGHDINLHYALSVRIFNLTDDIYEENDRFVDSSNISFGVTLNNLVCIDHDYYSFTVPAYTRFVIETYYNASEGDLRVLLFDILGTLLEISELSVGNSNKIYRIQNSTSSSYFLLIDSFSGVLNYTIRVRNDTIPTAQFSCNYTSPTNSPAEILFTDLSISIEGIASWYWNFGDNTSSIFQNVSHIYTIPGNYTVTLTVVDIDGDSSFYNIDIIIKEESSKGNGDEDPVLIFFKNNWFYIVIGAAGFVLLIGMGVHYKRIRLSKARQLNESGVK